MYPKATMHLKELAKVRLREAFFASSFWLLEFHGLPSSTSCGTTAFIIVRGGRANAGGGGSTSASGCGFRKATIMLPSRAWWLSGSDIFRKGPPGREIYP